MGRTITPIEALAKTATARSRGRGPVSYTHLGTNTFLGAGYRTINYNKVGWTAGGGIEWMAFPNWSVKIEYLYYDLGSVTSTGVLSAFTPVPPVAGVYALSESKTHLNGNVVRAGINYHFNWFEPAPVVAKY